MRTLSATGAIHFVSGFGVAGTSVSIGVLRYVEATYATTTVVSEGTPAFDELRRVLLRETDRCIFLASSNFIRSIEALRASSSSWCVVGLYYSSFYAAHAILGLLGCWYRSRNRWIDVVDANPDNQKLQYHTTKYMKGLGTHELFWHVYYTGIAPLAAWFSPDAARAVNPVSANESWFIQLRNKVNYRPAEAFALMRSFESSYVSTNIPACFPGELNSAYQVAESFLTALRELVIHTGLETDVFPPKKSRKAAIRKLVNGARAKEMTGFSKSVRAACEF